MENPVMPVSRVSTATVVAIVSPRTREGTVETLSALSAGGVRPVLISLGTGVDAQRRDRDGVTIIDGLLPRYLDNAVASLRLSSLPTLAWWRADEPHVLEELAPLVDRVVLDVDDPSAAWALVPALADRASVSDMRWARLTRWRDLIAQFFDIPEVRSVADRFDRVDLLGQDRHEMRLLAGWLASRLPARDRLEVRIDEGGSASIDAARVHCAVGTLGVRLLSARSCLETSVEMSTGHASRRAVAAGDRGALALIGEELRVRARDVAFEDAVRAAETL